MDNFPCQNVNKYFYKHYFLGCKNMLCFYCIFSKETRKGGASSTRSGEKKIINIAWIMQILHNMKYNQFKSVCTWPPWALSFRRAAFITLWLADHAVVFCLCDNARLSYSQQVCKSAWIGQIGGNEWTNYKVNNSLTQIIITKEWNTKWSVT